MARESTITLDQVVAAADSIKALGGKPTARAVREALGTGSMATVLKLLQQWQDRQMRTPESPMALPVGLQRALVDFIGQEVAGAKADLQADLVDARQANADLIAESERQASTIEIQAEALESVQVDRAGLSGRLAQVESDLAKSGDDVAAERQAAEHARIELAKAQLRLEAVPRIESEIEKVRAELLETRAKAAELHEAAAVATAKLEAAEAARTKAETQIEVAAAREAATAKALENERVSVQACQARLESAARELAAAGASVTKARAEAKRSSEEAAELRGQLAAVKDRPAAVKTPVKGEKQ